MPNPPQKNYLLLGAGFSRNWGGWLAPEVDEYLLGRREIGPATRNVLFLHRRKGGFESALAELQGQNNRDERLPELLSALKAMFVEMNNSLQRFTPPSNPFNRKALQFLSRFDAIFTLNQDLLLEHIYQKDPTTWDGNGKWSSGNSPGLKNLQDDLVGRYIPDPANFRTIDRCQPYFKLHGSSNWETSTSNEIMVMGGNKGNIVSQFPLLKWYHDEFKHQISTPTATLMIIGYSFGDDHINRTIVEGVKTGVLKIFIIDPIGLDVLDRNRHAQIYTPSELFSDLWPNLAGASRRSLREIFGDDLVEHRKIMRFIGDE